MFKKVQLVALLAMVLGVFAFGTAAQEEIEIRFWMHQNPAFIEANQALIDAFEAENPGISVTLESFDYEVYIQTLQTSMAAGNEADVLELFGTWVCSYADRLAPMPEDVLTYEEASEMFYAAPLDGYYCNEQLYGLPSEFNIEAGLVLVDQDAFEAAGLEYPPAWESFDDVIADAQALTVVNDGFMDVAGFNFITADAMAFHLFSGILQHGGEYWLEDSNGVQIDTDEGRAVLEQLMSWVEAGVIDPFLFNADSNWVGTAFFTGQSPIGFIGPWIVPIGLSDFPDVNFSYVNLPSYAGEEPSFVADAGWGKVVSANSEHQEAAFALVEFMTENREYALQWNVTTGTVPALIEAAESPELLEAMPWMAAPLNILDYGRYIGPLPDRDRVWYDIVYPTTLAYLQGNITIDEALATMETEINATFE